MENDAAQKEIYIVLSQTGTSLSALLKLVTGAPYNHVSVSLRKDLYVMYSFGRRHPYNPFWGGFVQESPHWGTFKRFPETEAAVVSLPVTPAQYRAIEARLADMYSRRTQYHYNILGLLLAALGVKYRGKHHYYCSEFVKDTLTRFQVIEEGETAPIPQPIHFLSLKDGRLIYQGKLRLYR